MRKRSLWEQPNLKEATPVTDVRKWRTSKGKSSPRWLKANRHIRRIVYVRG